MSHLLLGLLCLFYFTSQVIVIKTQGCGTPVECYSKSIEILGQDRQEMQKCQAKLYEIQKENEKIMQILKPKVFQAQTGNKSVNGALVWNTELLNTDKEFYELNLDKTIIFVKQSGIYKIGFKILVNSGKTINPILYINGFNAYYAHSGLSDSYHEAHLNIYHKITTLSELTVKFENVSDPTDYIYNGRLTYFYVERVGDV